MASAAVNQPTVAEDRDRSIEQKLRLYGALTAFQKGKLPSDIQLDAMLNGWLNHDVMTSPSRKLSREGQSLVRDARAALYDLKKLILTKNDRDVLQDFIWQTRHIDGANAGVPDAPVDGETAKQHGSEAVEGLRTLGMLLVSNGQFRKLLSDAAIILRDIAGDAAENAASKVNPSQDQLAQVDKPAQDNVWHETPTPGQMKEQVKAKLQQNKPMSKDEAKDAAGNTLNNQGDIDAETAANTARNAIPDETQNRARETKARQKERMRRYLQGKFPEERREQVIWRLKKTVVECQGHPDYQQAITTLLNLAETYVGHANTIGQQAAGSVQGAHQDTALQTAEKELKLLIERYANNTSSEPLFDAINTIYRDADQDPELKNWFTSMNAYVRKCLQEQGYILEDESTNEWNRLYDRGNFLLRERYRSHTDRIIDEVKFLGDQFNQDPLNQKVAQSFGNLFEALGHDENGKPTFKPHLVKDLTDVIIPEALASIGYIPIPRIEYSDPQVDLVVENLVIESDNLTPNLLEFWSENTKRWGRQEIASSSKHAIELKVAGIQMDLRDVAYYIKKKEGFPKVTDQGLMDIFLGGSGFSFKIKMSTADKNDKQNFFKINSVDVDIKNLKLKVNSSSTSHKILLKVLKPFVLKVVRPTLQKILEKTIKDKAHELDTFLYQVKLEADRAQQDVVKDPENAPNIYNRYFTAFQKKMTEGKQKAAQVQQQAENTRLNIAPTAEDSLFPEVRLPGGISTKATEFRDLALQGENWQSHVFDAINSGEPGELPSAGEIVRRERGHSNGSARGQSSGHAGPSSNNPYSQQMDQALGTGTGQASSSSAGQQTMFGGNNPVLTGQAPQVPQGQAPSSREIAL